MKHRTPEDSISLPPLVDFRDPATQDPTESRLEDDQRFDAVMYDALMSSCGIVVDRRQNTC